jgi:outer membrane protein TolC
MQRHIHAAAVAAVLGCTVTGCVLAPRAAHDERLRAERAGAPWAQPRGERTPPPLSAAPGWRELLRRALLTNGALEAAYHEWRAALAGIDVAAAYPNTNLSLGYEYLFSDEKLKSWDRNTFVLGFDPMQNLSFPTKPLAAGRTALAEAQAAGDRFLAAKLALQRDVLVAWYDVVLAAERLRLERERGALAGLVRDLALVGSATEAPQTTTIDAAIEQARADDRIGTLATELRVGQARLNALAGRAPEALVALPGSLPEPRALPDDAAVLEAGVRNNPELAALGHDRDARTRAIAAARQEFIPDVNPFVGIEGGMAQAVGVAVSLPARISMIRGQIAQARIMEARAVALEAQGRHDRAAEFVATLAALRDAERRAGLYRHVIVPQTAQLVAGTRAAYESGETDLAALVEAERLSLETRSMLAEARVERERRLAELEALGGFDAETLRPRTAEEHAS